MRRVLAVQMAVLDVLHQPILSFYFVAQMRNDAVIDARSSDRRVREREVPMDYDTRVKVQKETLLVP